MTGHERFTGDYHRGIGAGPAVLSSAGPKLPEHTIKNINKLLFVIKQIYITALKEQDINFLQAKAEAKIRLCYKLSVCKNNSRSFKVHLTNKFQVPKTFFIDIMRAIKCQGCTSKIY